MGVPVVLLPHRKDAYFSVIAANGDALLSWIDSKRPDLSCIAMTCLNASNTRV